MEERKKVNLPNYDEYSNNYLVVSSLFPEFHPFQKRGCVSWTLINNLIPKNCINFIARCMKTAWENWTVQKCKLNWWRGCDLPFLNNQWEIRLLPVIQKASTCIFRGPIQQPIRTPWCMIWPGRIAFIGAVLYFENETIWFRQIHEKIVN